MEYVWVEKDKNIKKILNEEMKIHVKWNKKADKDYLELSRQYMNASYITLKDVIECQYNSNIKYDAWFLPGIYMMRQAIELLLKAGFAVEGATKSELQKIFIVNKHNLKELYNIFKDRYCIKKLNESEKMWLEKYLDSIELVDSSSDLFRYPFKDKFMHQYGNEALDIRKMSNKLIYCYSTLNKMIFGEWFNEVELDIEEEPQFIHLAKTAINNCYLWDLPWSDGFHRQVIGYSDVATFLFERFKESNDGGLFYPIVFLMRNAIEIGLKRILHIKMEQSIDENTIIKKRNSHLLYKDLWKSIKPMLVHYAEECNYDKETLDLAETYIESLNSLDKNGDMFRYPCTFSNEYKFNNKEVDVENFYSYMLGLFNFIDGCNSWLEEINDWEMKMRSYRGWEE